MNQQLVASVRRKGRGKDKKYKPAVFLEAIPGSAGLISTIAKKVGCCRDTAAKYINDPQYPEIMQAFVEECELQKDLSESVILRNIQMAAKEQTEKRRIVDTSDAKWYLMMKAKDRGYSNTQKADVNVTGKIENQVDVNYSIEDTAKILAILEDAGILPSGTVPDDQAKANQVHPA